jgi:hypothetical protein
MRGVMLGRVFLLMGLGCVAACPPDATGNYGGCREDADCLNGYRCTQGSGSQGQCTRNDGNTNDASVEATDGAVSPSTCDLAQLTQVCGALGMAQDGVRCRCVPAALDSGSVATDGGPVCNTALLHQVCSALSQLADDAACVCRVAPPPDAGTPLDAGRPECLSDAECAGGSFCCAGHCRVATQANVQALCGCEPTDSLVTWHDCTTSTRGRHCTTSGGTQLDTPTPDLVGRLPGAQCGCVMSGADPDGCGFGPSGLVGFCDNGACIQQSDLRCGASLAPCGGSQGGDTCVPGNGLSGTGVCACSQQTSDVRVTCPSLTEGLFSATRCKESTLVTAPLRQCSCGLGGAPCEGTASSACCANSGGDAQCSDLTVDSNNCGVCGMHCADTGNKRCAVRPNGTFPACGADGNTLSWQFEQCRAPSAPVSNPRATTDRPAAFVIGGVYPCVCSAFRAYAAESACPPGRFCCPAVPDGGAGGCCINDCGAPTNECITSVGPPDGGTVDGG